VNSDRIARLSPEKRQLLERLLRERASDRDTRRENREPIPPRASEESPLLSYAQRRMWFLARSEPESPAYNVPFAMRLRGVLHASALRVALDEIVNRHAVLRTAFMDEQGEPRLVISPSLRTQWEEVHLDGRLSADAFTEAARLAEQAGLQPLDIAHPPLLRAILFRFAPEDHVLWLVSHHIAFDGWSVGVLLRELALAYPAFAAGRRPELPALALQYTDYARWERTAVTGKRLEQLLSYWKTRLTERRLSLSFLVRGVGASTLTLLVL